MAIQNVSGVIEQGLEQSIETLISILGIVIGIAGVSLIFWIITLIINYRREKIIKDILKNVEEINNKINKSAKK